MSTPADVALPTAHIEIWSDIACPWCYIGKRRFTDALAGFPQRDRVAVTWRSYQLAPDTPAGLNKPEIDALVEMKGMPAEQVRQMFSQVSATAAQVGLDIDFDTVIAANTFDAHRLLHLAGDKRDELLEALFRAHFVGGEIVDDREALVRIAASIGSMRIRSVRISTPTPLRMLCVPTSSKPGSWVSRECRSSSPTARSRCRVPSRKTCSSYCSNVRSPTRQCRARVDPVADDADGCAGDNCVV